MKRLFVAVPVSENVRARIKPLYEALKETGADLKFVSLENLHFTLKFLGNLDDSKVAQIKEKLEAITRSEHGFEIRLKKVGVFPSLKRINAIWIAAENSRLLSLMKKVNEELAQIRKEKREEVPHVTIARVKSGRNKKKLQQVLKRVQNNEFGEMPVDKLVLYESQLTPEGPVYTVLEEFVLKR